MDSPAERRERGLDQVRGAGRREETKHLFADRGKRRERWRRADWAPQSLSHIQPKELCCDSLLTCVAGMCNIPQASGQTRTPHDEAGARQTDRQNRTLQKPSRTFTNYLQQLCTVMARRHVHMWNEIMS